MKRPVKRRTNGTVRRAVGLFVVLAASVACWPRRSAAQPPPPQNNTVYQIFVRSFADGPDAGEVGDLRGVIDRLDYLNDGKPETDNDLEVGILWLMPVFPTTSYHGYDVTDYEKVNPEYGSLDDLKALVTEAHKRGMRVILDVPFNHTSDAHPWFRDALTAPDARRRAFYHIWPDDARGEDGWHTTVGDGGKRLKYFGLFGGNMPDLNFDNREVRDEVKRVARFWLDQGVDGFRLDAAKHVYGWTFNLTGGDILANNGWWREFSDSVYKQKPDAVLVGEVLGDRGLLARHAWGLNALVDEPFLHDGRNQLVRPGPGFVSRWKEFVDRAEAENPDAPYASFVYLASHDENPRLASYLEKEAPAGEVDARYRLGMCLLMSTGKFPILYSGDEVMQRGWKWNGNGPRHEKPGDGSGVYDETLREPLPWSRDNRPGNGQTGWQPGRHAAFLPKFDRPDDGVSVEEQGTGSGTLNLVRALTNLRTGHPAFADGDVGNVVNDGGDWMAFERVNGNDRYLVLLNTTPRGGNYQFHDRHFPQWRNAQLVFWSDNGARQWKDETKDNKNIDDTVFVPPFGMVLLKQRP